MTIQAFKRHMDGLDNLSLLLLFSTYDRKLEDGKEETAERYQVIFETILGRMTPHERGQAND